MPAFRYRILDVFTDTPFAGNPLAVFSHAAGLSGPQMQKIAKELNISETVFLSAADDPACVARARIFTPRDELPFAGHPTIGTALVVCDEGLVEPTACDFCLQEGIGRVRVRLERTADFMAWLTTPPVTFGAEFERAACAKALGLTAADCLDVPVLEASAGVPAVFVALRDPASVDRASLNPVAMRALVRDAALKETFVFAPTSYGAYSRMFAPELGIAEDPATGGLTGPLAAFMMRFGLAEHAGGTRFISEQGVKMGRRSILHVRVAGDYGKDAIEVGGRVTPVADGTFYLP